MSTFSATSLRRLLPATLILAGVGLVAGCNTTTATPHSRTAYAAAPLACEITAQQNGHMVNFQGRVMANESLSGTYSLTLSGSGTSIRQGGAFTARAGETVTVGQANLSGSADRYNATMTLSVNGGTYNCAVSN